MNISKVNIVSKNFNFGYLTNNAKRKIFEKSENNSQKTEIIKLADEFDKNKDVCIHYDKANDKFVLFSNAIIVPEVTPSFFTGVISKIPITIILDCTTQMYNHMKQHVYYNKTPDGKIESIDLNKLKEFK